MTTENQASANAPTSSEVPPKEVIDLQNTLQDISIYRNVIDLGQWEGKYAEHVTKLRTFLTTVYDQVFKQFDNHPFVLDFKAKQEAADKASRETANASASQA